MFILALRDAFFQVPIILFWF